jgi:hypothetical protein
VLPAAPPQWALQGLYQRIEDMLSAEGCVVVDVLNAVEQMNHGLRIKLKGCLPLPEAAGE